MAFSSHGTKLKMGDGASPEVFATVGEVKDISGPAMTLNTEDATSHDSNGWREVVPTILEPGDVSFDINYTGTTTQAALRAAQLARTLASFQLVFPFTVEETHSFSGYVTSFEYSAPVEGIVTASVTISVTGEVEVA